MDTNNESRSGKSGHESSEVYVERNRYEVQNLVLV